MCVGRPGGGAAGGKPFEIDATVEYLKALAEYRAALATDVGAPAAPR